MTAAEANPSPLRSRRARAAVAVLAMGGVVGLGVLALLPDDSTELASSPTASETEAVETPAPGAPDAGEPTSSPAGSGDDERAAAPSSTTSGTADATDTSASAPATSAGSTVTSATAPTTAPTTSSDSPVAAGGTGDTYEGVATFYAADGTGNCSFDASPGDLMVAAMNNAQYDNAAWCGARVLVEGPKGSVVVRIVDRCPECEHGHLDLSREAFVQIGDEIDGIIPISWQLVTSPVDGPIRFRIKEGSSAYWIAVQLRNHRTPIANLEYLDAGGQWQTMGREPYNYFVAPDGLGGGPFTFRVTDRFGHSIVESDVPLVVAGVTTGQSQLPAP